MANKPMITREFVNERLKANGWSDPDKMSEGERFDAALRIVLRSGPVRSPFKRASKPVDRGSVSVGSEDKDGPDE